MLTNSRENSRSALFEREPRPEVAQDSTGSAEPRHLIAIPGTGWSLWRWVGLRSAGFPSEGVLSLAASPDLMKAAEAVLSETQALEACRQKTNKVVDSALDELRAQAQWNDKKKRKALLDARTLINAGKNCNFCSELEVAAEITEYNAAIQRLDAARSAYCERFSRFRASNADAIRTIARRADFREALTWQNRAALRTAIDPLLRNRNHGSPRTSGQRQHEELVASYWQRYCVKNDTIGFFGPVGWARFDPTNEHFAINPGADLLATRTVYWESWTIKALAAVIENNDQIQPWIVPFSMPMLRIDNGILFHPRLGPVPITTREAALLEACNGEDTAKRIARGLLSNSSDAQFESEDDVYALLRDLVQKRYAFWKFQIPSGPHPEKGLRSALSRIEDPTVRDWSLGLLNELESAKARVEECAGNVDALDVAYENLEQTFTRITGAPATRLGGKIYAGRTLIYLDCRRDVEVSLGPDLLSSLGPPLSLLLASLRWFTARLAERYKDTFREIHSAFVRSTGEPVVDAAPFMEKIGQYFFQGAHALIASLQEEFRDKWERVLRLGSSAGPVNYTCHELRDRIESEFPPSSPGWLGARYHSPDIMIAAASNDAIRQGDYCFVVGEVHAGVNTLVASLFVNQHPSPQDLLDAVEHDFGTLHVLPVTPSTEYRGSRTAHSLITKSTYFLEYSGSAFASDRSRVIPVSSLVLENRDNEIVAKSRYGNFQMPLVELVGWLLSLTAADCFKGAIAARRHTPRISIGRLVINRESWRFPVPELRFVKCRDSAELFLQTRSWAREQGIPRFVFVKVPLERQPSYVDLESPILVDIFARLVRRALDDPAATGGNVDISEMLPATDQLWLADANNRRYTSELRFIAVDNSEFACCKKQSATHHPAFVGPRA
jgi:Lantibiotic dehydratase, N terminus